MKLAKRVDYVKPSAIRNTGKLIAQKKGCISFAAGHPSPALMPYEALKKISGEILTNKSTVCCQYGMTKGYDPLIDKIIQRMETKDIDCNKDNIQITTGSQQGIFLSAMMFLNQGDTIVVENPTYLGALSSFSSFMCDYKGIDADENGMRMCKLEEALKADKNIKFAYVIPNFSNPTGKTWTEKKRRRILELADEYDIMIIEDDPYGEIRFEGKNIPSIKSMDKNGRVIYLGSFSKVLIPGLRVGFMICDKPIADKLELLKQGVDLQSNQLAQVQVNEFFEQYSLDDQIGNIANVYKSKRDIMLKEIDEKFPKEITRTHPEGGMFVWLTLPDGKNAAELCEKAIDEIGVGFVPGGSFFASGEYENTFRLNFATADEEGIVEGIDRLGKFFKREL